MWADSWSKEDFLRRLCSVSRTELDQLFATPKCGDQVVSELCRLIPEMRTQPPRLLVTLLSQHIRLPTRSDGLALASVAKESLRDFNHRMNAMLGSTGVQVRSIDQFLWPRPVEVPRNSWPVYWLWSFKHSPAVSPVYRFMLTMILNHTRITIITAVDGQLG